MSQVDPAMTNLAKTIDDAFEKRNDVTPATKGEVRDAVETALNLLDSGKARVAERGGNGAWTVNQWLKKAVLLSFRLSDNAQIAGAARHSASLVIFATLSGGNKHLDLTFDESEVRLPGHVIDQFDQPHVTLLGNVVGHLAGHVGGGCTGAR